MNIFSKTSGLSPYLKATSSAVGNSIRPIPTPALLPENLPSVQPPELIVTHYSLGSTLPTGRLLAKSGGIGSGLAAKGQLRTAHTDIKFPDYDVYRIASKKDPKKPSKTNEDVRNVISYVPVIAMGAMGVFGAKSVAHAAVSTWGLSPDTLAMGKIEIKTSAVPEGKSMTFKWRNKPLFVRHRTKVDIEREAAVSLSELRDPQHDSERAPIPEWLVLVGVCTHLGCVPIADAGDFNGYYCPCHGSHYDGAGRIRKGPAPLNLEVPPHQIVGENLIVG